MHADAISDISDALMRLRSAYRKYDIHVQDQLAYSDPVQARDAKRRIYSVAASSQILSFRVEQKSGDMDTELVGFKLLWT